MRKLFYLVCFLYVGALIGQQDDPVLFTVADDAVHLSEFKYIYEKNNSDKADYSKQSVEEYLELYKKFKLKVHRARVIGLDTIKTLQKELEGYRKQLAATYLKDKEISERLVNEVVERYTEDREVSHIFVAAGAKFTAEQKSKAEEKINDIYQKLVENKGVGFGEMAQSLSEDKVSAKNKGYLGFYTSPLPDGFYEFENAMYNTEVGGFSKPFRSKMGHHIVHVSQTRDARGEMEIAHILVRKSKKGNPVMGARIKIDSVQQLLKAGRSFESLAAKYSDDLKTRDKGGYLGFFGVNQYELTFENAAFSLHQDGAHSKVIETKLGYHIIKRISKRDYSDKNRAKKRIESRINNDNRFKIAEEKLINDVKKEANFSEKPEQLRRFVQKAGDDFYSYKWVPHVFDSKEMTVFSLGGKAYTLNDFSNYVKSNIRERLKFAKTTPISEATDVLYDKYLKETIMSYEEANLESKYPDFKALMREYREGILLFEITKNEVWDKASQDTLGLQAFYESNKSKYIWPNRTQVKKISVTAKDGSALQSAYKYAKKKKLDKFIKKYKSNINYTIDIKEETLNQDTPEGMAFQSKKAGHFSELTATKNSGTFYVVTGMLPSKMKTLAEARGYVIADYQDYLEKEWVTMLKAEHPITVNQETLKSIIR